MLMRTNSVQPTISTFSVTKGGRVAETYACFSHWDFSLSLDENLDRFRRDNPILASTSAWLKEMRRILRVRFGSIDEHRSLIQLAKASFPLEKWTPILLWHLCMRELLLSDFLETWLYPRKQDGLLRVRADDVRGYMETLRTRGLLDAEWTENTINRMASGLPSYAADFGLLRGKAVKEVVPFHLPDEALLYVLHDLAEETASAERVLSDGRWRRFLMSRVELEQELLRLHQLHLLRFEVAGSLVALDLPCKSLGEYVERMVG